LQVPGVTGTIVSIQDVTPPPAPEAPPATEPAPADPAAPSATAPTETTPSLDDEQIPQIEAPEPRGGDPANGPQAAQDGKPQQKRQKVTDEPGPEAEVEGDGK